MKPLRRKRRRERMHGDRVVKGKREGWFYSPDVLVSGHRDEPLSRRGRLMFWSLLGLILVGGAIGIALSR